MSKEKFFICDCGAEGYFVSVLDVDDRLDGDNQEFFFAMFSAGQYSSKRANLFQRLKYAWYHIKTGEKYSDQIILTTEKAKALADFINENSKNK